MTEPAETPVTKPEPPTHAQRIAQKVAENVGGARDKAERWWRLNRVERMTQSDIAAMERAAGNKADQIMVNRYIVAYENLSGTRVAPMDKSLAAELYDGEIERIVAKQKEIDAWDNDTNRAGALSPHSRFQTWAVLEAMRIGLMEKFFRARGVELGESEGRSNLLSLPAELRSKVYEAMHRSHKVTMTETKREMTLEPDDERTDANATPGIVETHQA